MRLEVARTRKEQKYPELLDNRRCKLVVVAMEIGGRWSEEAWSFLQLLAGTKARTALTQLKRSTEYCSLRRWSGMIAVAAQTAYAGSLLGESTGKNPLHDDVLPDWGDVLCDREVATEGPGRLL